MLLSPQRPKYDPANRLSSVTSNQLSVTYGYNGLGDRLTQNNTHYALDLNTDLTQVLGDGTNTYLYGLDPLVQTGNTNTDYFLGDAHGSTRQLTDAIGEIGLARSYDPFGNARASTGDASSIFGYTGEQTDVSGLVFLRARYYDSSTGRFISRDSWSGDPNAPITFNSWVYANANPILYTDPSGNFSICDCSVLLPLAFADSPVPGPADAVALIGCVILLAVSYVALYMAEQQVPEIMPRSVPDTRPPWVVAPRPWVVAPPQWVVAPQPQENPNPKREPIRTPWPFWAQKYEDKSRVTLFRAVDSRELSDVQTTGTYGYSPHGGGKYFAFTYSGVVRFARSAFNAGKIMMITSTDVPSDFLIRGTPFDDIGGAGLSIHFSDAVLPALYRVMSPIRILGLP